MEQTRKRNKRTKIMKQLAEIMDALINKKKEKNTCTRKEYI